MLKCGPLPKAALQRALAKTIRGAGSGCNPATEKKQRSTTCKITGSYTNCDQLFCLHQVSL